MSSRGNKRVLFICGSMNQTTQLHQIAERMPEIEAWFSPFHAGPVWEFWRKAGLVEWTIVGNKLRDRCATYLRDHGLRIDLGGASNTYDLIVISTDVVLAKPPRGTPVVLVQEGILDPPNAWLPWIVRFPWLVPRWTNGTAGTGLSLCYERFCVASQGYVEYFANLGIPRERLVATGIPNFDDCERFRNNDFPLRNYALVCTSDARETFKKDDRATLIRYAREVAGGRPLVFKLHPNENVERASAEIRKHAPDAHIFDRGSAEHMIANCDVFVAQYSSTAFVALALGKEVHSYFELEELRRLMPAQHGRAAENVAQVCREVLAAETASEASRATPLPRKRPWFQPSGASS
jgi:hypothetical protein